MTDAARRSQRAIRLWRMLGLGLAFAIAFAAGTVVWALRQPAPFDPIGPLPVQAVDLDHTTVVLLPGSAVNDGSTAQVELPTLIVKGGIWPTVPVSGVKCYTEPVEVAGAVSWREQDPVGFASAETRGRAPRVAGCLTFSYQNVVPDDVRAEVKNRAANGQPTTVWAINGTEEPVVDDGRPVTVDTWRTENFAIRYED